MGPDEQIVFQVEGESLDVIFVSLRWRDEQVLVELVFQVRGLEVQLFHDLPQGELVV